MASGRIVTIRIAGWTGMILSFGLIVAALVAILYIHNDRSHLQRVPATIVAVQSAKRDRLIQGVPFSTYSITVRYRESDFGEITRDIEKRTYGIPSAGDSITLLIDPKSGHVEGNPFPELWIFLAVVSAAFAWLMRFFYRMMQSELAWEKIHAARQPQC